jgi:hypothetical protein
MWLAVVESAERRGFIGVTVERLASIAADACADRAA